MSQATPTPSFTEFDVFLAHNSEDKLEVREIAEALKMRGLRPWLDEEQIQPGTPFLDAIQKAIKEAKCGAIFISLKGLGKWQEEEQRDLLDRCVEEKIPLIPVLLPGIEKIPQDMNETLRFANKRRNVSFHQRIDEVKALNELVWGITKRKPMPEEQPCGIVVQVPRPKKSCFLAMSQEGLEDIYEAVKNALNKTSLQKLMTTNEVKLIQTRRKERDSIFVQGIDSIIDNIRSAEVVIAVCVSKDNFSQLDPDVMYELGLAHSLGKPLCVIINKANYDRLSKYILMDIPKDEFVNFELTEIDDKQTLIEELATKLEVIIKRLQFPYLTEADCKGITSIDWNQPPCSASVLQERFSTSKRNFCKIVQLSLDIHKRFPNLRYQLNSLYKEVEEVKDTLEDPNPVDDDIRDRNIRKEIDDVISAWSKYLKELCHGDEVKINKLKKEVSILGQNCDLFADILAKERQREIEESFNFFRQGKGESLTSVKTAYRCYRNVVQLIEDYHKWHNPLAERLDEKTEVIFEDLGRFGAPDRLMDAINSLMHYMKYSVDEQTGRMIEQLTKVMCYG